MAVPKANQRAVNKYVKNNYDRVNVTMPKGRLDGIKAHAAGHGESVNGFINRAIDETMQRDGGQTARTAHSGVEAISLSPEKQNASQGRAGAGLTIEEQNERLRAMIAEKKAQSVKPAPVHNDLRAEIEAARMALTGEQESQAR